MSDERAPFVRCGKAWIVFGRVAYCQRPAVWKQTHVQGGVDVIESRCRRHRLRDIIAEERIR